MTKQIQRTDEQWKAILLDYEQSPDTQTAVLARHSIHKSMLDKARRRYGLKFPRGDARNLAALAGEKAPDGRSNRSKHPKQAEAIALYHQGEMTVQAIADKLEVHKSTVSGWIQRDKAKTGAPGRYNKPVASTIGPETKQAIILLRQMDREVMRLIRSNKIQSPDTAHMLGMMALRALTGDQ